MMGSHVQWAGSLWQIPLRRVTGKQSAPRWMHQVTEAARFHRKLERSTLANETIGGVRLRDWLDEMGCLSGDQIPIIRHQAVMLTKRGQRLHAHNASAQNKRRHVLAMWRERDRPRCLICGGMGYAARPGSFLEETCTAPWCPGTLVKAQHDLTVEISHLQSRGEALAQLRRQFA